MSVAALLAIHSQRAVSFAWRPALFAWTATLAFAGLALHLRRIPDASPAVVTAASLAKRSGPLALAFGVGLATAGLATGLLALSIILFCVATLRPLAIEWLPKHSNVKAAIPTSLAGRLGTSVATAPGSITAAPNRIIPLPYRSASRPVNVEPNVPTR